MQLSTDVGALRTRRQGWAGSLPAWVELILVLAAIAALVPAFDRVAEFADGREHRFVDNGLQVTGLSEPTLPTVFATHAQQEGDARQSLVHARKNEAMRRLLSSAGMQWASAMLLGFALLVWSRRPVRP